MALRLLADHCLSNYIIQTLQDAGHEVLRLRELLPVESADPVVIAKAQEINAILLSLNGDFANTLTYPPKHYKGIIALQLHDHMSTRCHPALSCWSILTQARGMSCMVKCVH